MSLSSDSVSLKGKGKCQSERLTASSAGALTPWLCGRLVGWVRERAYLRTVLREMPSWRAISRRESPWILACCTAFQSASCSGVSSLRDGGSVWLFSAAASSTTGVVSRQ